MEHAVDETCRLLSNRLEELRPAVDEATRIEATLRILRPGSGATRRGDREQAFVELMRLNPDASVDELAEALHTKPSYVAKLRRRHSA
jgi:hypothetical protein